MRGVLVRRKIYLGVFVRWGVFMRDNGRINSLTLEDLQLGVGLGKEKDQIFK